MCTRDAILDIPDKDIIKCWAMCKMAVTIEHQDYKKYSMMQFPEFLEFIGRIGDLKFKNSPEMSGNSLAWKIEMILEDLCPYFGLKKNDVEIEHEENSESDDDY
jgi:hypothetical protein